jgi:WD40 repeat protein
MPSPLRFALALSITFACLFFPSPLFAQKPELRSTLRGDTGAVRCVAFSPDGKTLTSASYDRDDATIRYWDVASGKQQTSVQAFASSIVLSSDGKSLESGVPSKPVEVWKTATPVGTIIDKRAICVDPAVEFSPDGKTFASGGVFETEIKLWDVSTKKNIANLKVQDGASAMAFAPDGKTLAYVCFHRPGVRLWDVATGKNTVTLAKDQYIVCASFSPDGKTMVIASDSVATVRLLDVPGGKEQAALKGHAANIGCAVFSPDGKTLATGSEDGTIKLWDPGKGQEIATFEAHKDRISALAFSADGKTLASASKDTIKLWDVGPGK